MATLAILLGVVYALGILGLFVYVYQLEIDTAPAPANPRDWHFVVADHQCNTSDVLSFPHQPQPPQVIR